MFLPDCGRGAWLGYQGPEQGPGLLHPEPVLHGGLPDRGLSLQRLEAGQEVRDYAALLVLCLHGRGLPLRAKHLRRVQPARMPEQLLNKEKASQKSRESGGIQIAKPLIES